MKKLGSIILTSLLVVGCGAQRVDLKDVAPPEVLAKQADKLFIVDCLLPPKIKQLGRSLTYAAARQATKTSAADCELRGGEYTAFDRANYASALKIWLPLAQAGDAAAQNNVGELFEKGMGGAPDYAAAAQWYTKAAEQGLSAAQLNLGNLYEQGLGVEKDPVAALNLFRRASGIQDDGEDIVFYSTLKAATDAKQAEIDELSTQLNAKQAEVTGLKAELAEVEKSVASSKAEMQRLNAELGDAKEQLAKLEKSDKKVDVDKIKSLKLSIKQRLAALREKEQEVALLTQTADKQSEQILLAENDIDSLSSSGPSIELIEPAVVLTRSLPTVTYRSARKEGTLLGRIDAPSGLTRFTVNNKDTKVDLSGTFQVEVPLDSEKNKVSLVAMDKYGRVAELEFMMVVDNMASKLDSIAPAVPSASIDFGQYYALIIGNNNYPFMPDLQTAVTDARAVDNLLQTKYGYKTLRLENASRYEMLSALNELRNSLSDKDNLLIYYAGHGELDRVNNRGHWLPVDAEPTNDANWISNVAITDILNAMPAKHVMVVADSCYSGAMTAASVPRLGEEVSSTIKKKWMRVMARTRTRTVLTSGGLKPVLDNGGGNHSIFAKTFLDVLGSDKEIMEGQSLFWAVANQVKVAAQAYNIEQIPQYGPIKFAGHQAGEFFFVPVNGLKTTRVYDLMDIYAM